MTIPQVSAIGQNQSANPDEIALRSCVNLIRKNSTNGWLPTDRYQRRSFTIYFNNGRPVGYEHRNPNEGSIKIDQGEDKLLSTGTQVEIGNKLECVVFCALEQVNRSIQALKD
jgi:hypothetical protein